MKFLKMYFGEVVIAILGVGMIAGAILVARVAPEYVPSPKIVTVEHDGHKWVYVSDELIHHPDCSCLEK